MNGYTIRSVSEEGTYYYIKNWRKNKAIWVEEKHLKQEHLFSSLENAKRSLEKLLEIMDEYTEDEFSGVFLENGLINIVEDDIHFDIE